MHPELGRARRTQPLAALLRGVLCLSCVAFVLDGSRAAAKQGKVKSGSAAIEQLFDGVQPAIRECALTHGIYKGATVVELQATVMVARDGRVFTAQVTANLTPKGAVQKPDSLQSCVGDALRKMKFPESSDTFRKLLRNWKFATA
jgi:hypothetical protein